MDDERMACVPRLTLREHEILKLVSSGASQRRLAKDLGLSEFEARRYVERLRLKVAGGGALGPLADATQPKTSAQRARTPQPELDLVDPVVWMNIFDSHPDPLMYLSRDYKIMRMNDSQASLMGLNPSDCEGRYCYELFHNSDAPPAECPCLAVVRNGITTSIDVDFVSAGNCYRVTICPVKDKKGRVAGLLHAAHPLESSACTCSSVWHAGKELSPNVAHRPRAASFWRELLDHLLAFVLRYLGDHARDCTQRAALLTDFVSLLSDFQLTRIALLEPIDPISRTLFSHTFGKPPRKGASSTGFGTAFDSLIRIARREGFAREAKEGMLRCAVAMSRMLSGSATYIMVAECKENAAGGAYFRRDQMQFMCDVLGEIVHHATATDGTPRGQGLTMREIAVMRLLEGDYPCKTVADQLGVSLHTVRVHTKNIYRKLNVHSRQEAVKKWRTCHWNRCSAQAATQTPAEN